jgi:hypothetical protein
MKKSFLLWFATCLLLLVQQSALADLRFERFIPANPTADDLVEVEIWFSNTSTVLCDSPGPSDLPTFLTQQPNGALRFRFFTGRAPTSNGSMCFAGFIPPSLARYSLGRLPASSYQIELYAIDINSPTRPDIPVANVPLVVLPGTGAGTVISAPTLGGVGVFVLFLSILLGAVVMIKKTAREKILPSR